METLMIAHRGYSKFEKENTIAAFIAAGATNEFYGIETDVHVTKDGHYVIIHDENTSRVCDNKIAINVEESTFVEVSRVVLQDLDPTSLRRDLVIPELIDYLKICKKYNKVAVLELKQVFTEKQIQEILDIIKSVEMEDKMIIISFPLENLIKLRKLNPTIKAQWLLCVFDKSHIATLKEYHLGVDVQFKTIDKDGIDLCHQDGIEVNVWTVDNQEDAKNLAASGVDYITSNALKSYK